MKHFSIVLALTRAAMRDPNPAILQHAERLSEALEADGSTEEAKALRQAVEGSKKPNSAKLSPARVVLSRAVSTGEVITSNTAVPVDKETSVPLAELWTLEKIAGLEQPILDTRLERAVGHLVEQWTGADQLQSAGIKVPRSALFFGSPGTGKTRLALSIAQTLGLPVVLARLDGLTSSFLGTTARNVRALFDFANRYRCLLLLDEFDGIAKLRDDPQELGEVKRVVNAVLQAMDARAGVGLTIALTNHEGLLDPAVWRRFDARIHIILPDAMTRTSILERYLVGFSVSSASIKVLTWMTEGFSGSDIETMCDFIKRHMTLSSKDHPSVLDSVELFLDLSATLNRSLPVEALLKGRHVWVQEALSNRDFKIIQSDIAEIMGSTQSKVSRLARAVEKII
jgi:SpoVK/Ycf46/Vps4 family AAA+-type ATPase